MLQVGFSRDAEIRAILARRAGIRKACPDAGTTCGIDLLAGLVARMPAQMAVVLIPQPETRFTRFPSPPFSGKIEYSNQNNAGLVVSAAAREKPNVPT